MDVNKIRDHSSITFPDTDGVDWVVYYYPHTEEDYAGRSFPTGDVVGIELDADGDHWLDINGKDAGWWTRYEDAILTMITKHLEDLYTDYD